VEHQALIDLIVRPHCDTQLLSQILIFKLNSRFFAEEEGESLQCRGGSVLSPLVTSFEYFLNQTTTQLAMPRCRFLFYVCNNAVGD